MSYHKLIVSLLLIILVNFLLIGTPNYNTHGKEGFHEIAITYATFIGGSGFDDGYAVMLDDEGNIYITGATKSSNFPYMNGFGDTNPSAGLWRSVYVVKFSADGELLFSTIFGGTDQDTGTEIALDSQNNIIVVGITKSDDFPTTVNAFNQTFGGGTQRGVGNTCCGDAFLSIISNDGSDLIYSTYIGGSDAEGDIGLSLDDQDNIYVSGVTASLDYPITSNSYQTQLAGGLDHFVSKFTPNGTNLIYSTYIGGSQDELIRGGGVNGHNMALDNDNNIYIAGGTKSEDFPVTANAFDNTLNGVEDAFFLKLSSNGSNLIYSTFFGGDNVDSSWGMALRSDNSVHITGISGSLNFPVTADAFQLESAEGGCIIPQDTSACGDGFLTIFSENGELEYSTYFGGSGVDLPTSIAVDNMNNTIISGFTNSMFDFPLLNEDQSEFGGGNFDAFVLLFNTTNNLEYSSFFGGSTGWELANDVTVGETDEFYITGFTRSPDFPISENAYDETHNGDSDMILVKFSPGESIVKSIMSTTSTSSSTSKNDSASYSYLSSILTIFIIIPIYYKRNPKK